MTYLNIMMKYRETTLRKKIKIEAKRKNIMIINKIKMNNVFKIIKIIHII
jgi:hypothetical protein